LVRGQSTGLQATGTGCDAHFYEPGQAHLMALGYTFLRSTIGWVR
jgi:hypothetical protein